MVSDFLTSDWGLTRSHRAIVPNLMSESLTPSATGHCPWPSRFRLLAGCMAPSCVALIVLEECRFVVRDQDERRKRPKATGHREPIWVWEFCPIMIPSMESSFISHPMLHESLPILHHIRPLVPIKIHTILQFPIRPAPVSQANEVQVLSEIDALVIPFRANMACISGLATISTRSWAFKKPPFCLLHHLHLDFLCNVFIIKDCPSFPV